VSACHTHQTLLLVCDDAYSYVYLWANRIATQIGVYRPTFISHIQMYIDVSQYVNESL